MSHAWINVRLKNEHWISVILQVLTGLACDGTVQKEGTKLVLYRVCQNAGRIPDYLWSLTTFAYLWYPHGGYYI